MYKLLQQMEEEFFHPFPGFLANAVAVCHPVTQVSINHMGLYLPRQREVGSATLKLRFLQQMMDAETWYLQVLLRLCQLTALQHHLAHMLN